MFSKMFAPKSNGFFDPTLVVIVLIVFLLLFVAIRVLIWPQVADLFNQFTTTLPSTLGQ